MRSRAGCIRSTSAECRWRFVRQKRGRMAASAYAREETTNCLDYVRDVAIFQVRPYRQTEDGVRGLFRRGKFAAHGCRVGAGEVGWNGIVDHCFAARVGQKLAKRIAAGAAYDEQMPGRLCVIGHGGETQIRKTGELAKIAGGYAAPARGPDIEIRLFRALFGGLLWVVSGVLLC